MILLGVEFCWSSWSFHLARRSRFKLRAILGRMFFLVRKPLRVVLGVDVSLGGCNSEMTLSILQYPQTAKNASASPPQWDAEYRTLRVGQCVVKEYRVPSPNQEAILAAFQEEGWPHRIHDPLPPLGDIEPKSRVHDTIKRLNRHHKERLIRFRGDGTGEGVCWEYVEAATLAFPAVAESNNSPRRAA